MNHPALLNSFDLTGKTFVITGASSGLGRAMAEFIVVAGGNAVFVARREQQLNEAISAISRAEHCAAVIADLLDRESLGEVAARCEQAFGQVDGVINAAGINLRQSVDDVSIESWDQTVNLNLSVPFFFSRFFTRGMKARNYGRIINIASLQSERAFPNGLPYGASKGGVTQLTRAMSEAWSKDGITANAIAPGFFPTELTAPVFSNPEIRDWAAEQTTIGRNGALDDLYGVVVFFASAASNYITGQTLFVDGGFTAC